MSLSSINFSISRCKPVKPAPKAPLHKESIVLSMVFELIRNCRLFINGTIHGSIEYLLNTSLTISSLTVIVYFTYNTYISLSPTTFPLTRPLPKLGHSRKDKYHKVINLWLYIREHIYTYTQIMHLWLKGV